MADAARPWRRAEWLGAACLLAAMAFVSFAYVSVVMAVTAQRLHAYGLDGARMSDPVCFSPFCDFPDFWGAGILARGHSLATLYQPDAFLAWRRGLFGQGIPPLNWMYPPPALFAAVLVSWVPLVPGYFIWVAGLTGLSVLVLRWAGVAWRYIIVTMLSPAALWNLLLGQMGLICGALLVAGLISLPARPARAGALLACLAIKPQFGLAAPVLLLAGRNWRAMMAAAGAGLGIILLSAACFGWRAWQLFFGPARLAARIVLETPYPGEQIHAVSVFWALRSFGASTGMAFAVQGFSALAATCAGWRAWRLKAVDAPARVALTTCLVPLVTPYGYTDDLVGLSLAFVMLARRDRPGLSAGAALIWLMPALLPVIYVRWHIVVAPLVFVAGGVMAWRRMVAPRAARPA
jgi:hypothetical protein